jgi:hypothetical protein
VTDALFQTPRPVAPVAGLGPTPVDTHALGVPTGADCGRAQGEGEAPTARPHVIGVDLSLTRTGIACAHGADSLTPPRGLTGFPRLRWIRRAVLAWTAEADLVVVEGLSFASNMPSAQERAGLWHLVMVAIDTKDIRWTQLPPATLKKYATGKGNAGKDEVLTAAVRRLPIAVENNDQADAAWLCAAGHDLLAAPLLELPAVNRSALDRFRTNTREN